MLYAICILCTVYTKDERWRFWGKRKVLVVGLGRDGRLRYLEYWHVFAPNGMRVICFGLWGGEWEVPFPSEPGGDRFEGIQD